MKPTKLYWVEWRRGPHGTQNYKYHRAGAKAGKVSSLQAALDRKEAILRYDPQGTVVVWVAETEWRET